MLEAERDLFEQPSEPSPLEPAMRIFSPPAGSKVLVGRVVVSAHRAATPGPPCVRSMRLLTFAWILRLESGLDCNSGCK